MYPLRGISPHASFPWIPFLWVPANCFSPFRANHDRLNLNLLCSWVTRQPYKYLRSLSNVVSLLHLIIKILAHKCLHYPVFWSPNFTHCAHSNVGAALVNHSQGFFNERDHFPLTDKSQPTIEIRALSAPFVMPYSSTCQVVSACAYLGPNRDIITVQPAQFRNVSRSKKNPFGQNYCFRLSSHKNCSHRYLQQKNVIWLSGYQVNTDKSVSIFKGLRSVAVGRLSDAYVKEPGSRCDVYAHPFAESSACVGAFLRGLWEPCTGNTHRWVLFQKHVEITRPYPRSWWSRVQRWSSTQLFGPRLREQWKT